MTIPPLMVSNEVILYQIQIRTIVRLYKVGLSDGDKNGSKKWYQKWYHRL